MIFFIFVFIKNKINGFWLKYNFEWIIYSGIIYLNLEFYFLCVIYYSLFVKESIFGVFKVVSIVRNSGYFFRIFLV